MKLRHFIGTACFKPVSERVRLITLILTIILGSNNMDVPFGVTPVRYTTWIILHLPVHGKPCRIIHGITLMLPVSIQMDFADP